MYSLLFISLGITLLAQLFININYSKYKKINTRTNKSGFEVAREILDKNGLKDIYVVETGGNLTDHFDPNRKTIRLSSDIYHGSTIASNSVAAHEVGHALQHKEGYLFLKFRSSIIPLVNFSSRAGYIIILISLISGALDLLWLGIGLECIILLFQLITLPVEFNASNRGKKQLRDLNILSGDELNGASKMLFSAAMTYVASVLTAILEILRLVMIASSRDR